MNIETTVISVLDIIGILFGVVFLVMSIRGSRSLIGSFFKDYYWIMTFAALTLIFGFFIESAGELLGVNEDMIMLLHDLAMVIEGALFIYASYVLPNDARRYLEPKEKPTV